VNHVTFFQNCVIHCQRENLNFVNLSSTFRNKGTAFLILTKNKGGVSPNLYD
jgi:hypothetical protein